jgi:hypothetical protein
MHAFSAVKSISKFGLLTSLNFKIGLKINYSPIGKHLPNPFTLTLTQRRYKFAGNDFDSKKIRQRSFGSSSSRVTRWANFSPLGDCLLLAVFFKFHQQSKFKVYFFYSKCCALSILTKIEFGYILGDFSQTLLVTLSSNSAYARGWKRSIVTRKFKNAQK